MTSPEDSGHRQFGVRLQQATARYGRLCVGIDPHESLLRDWNLAESAVGAREFGLRVVEACVGHVGIIKPQIAFFERYGSAGFRALEDVLDAARREGLIVIADAKRGDIGSTMDGYARAWLTPGAPLEADALTVTPFLGMGALRPTMEFAHVSGKGLFVLAATSNPEAFTLQTATMSTSASQGTTISRHIVDEVWAFNANVAATTSDASAHAWGNIGVVIGATVDLAAAGLGTTLAPTAPVLSPGFGHQGAQLSDIPSLFGTLSASVIANESRGIVSGGPAQLTERIRERQAILQDLDDGHRGKGDAS